MRDTRRIPDLTFPSILYGKTETPWDLNVLLFEGGAAANRRNVSKKIDAGELGAPLLDRLKLVERLHEVLNKGIVGGGSRDALESNIELLRRMFIYADKEGISLTLVTVDDLAPLFPDTA